MLRGASMGARLTLVASPDYLRDRPKPRLPVDLLDHRAVVCRSQITGLILPWNLHSGDGIMQIVPPGATIVHDLASQIDLTVRGLGIVSAPAASVSSLVGAGKLERVLPSWFSPIEPVFLYFSSSRHQSAALRAFVAYLKGSSAPALMNGNGQAKHTVREPAQAIMMGQNLY